MVNANCFRFTCIKGLDVMSHCRSLHSHSIALHFTLSSEAYCRNIKICTYDIGHIFLLHHSMNKTCNDDVSS